MIACSVMWLFLANLSLKLSWICFHHKFTWSHLGCWPGETDCEIVHLWQKGGQKVKSACLEQSLNNLSLDGTTKTKEGSICLKPPPPPPAPLSPVKPAERSSFTSEPSTTEDTESHSKVELSPKETSKNIESSAQNVIDDDFGDFQAAGWFL